MAETSENKFTLKIMVDVKAKKVVFAEANKDFVDFLFSLISLPLSSVTQVLLLNRKGMLGCLGTLYKSIESLDTCCFEQTMNSRSVLKPRASVSVPLLSLHDCYAPRSVTAIENKTCLCSRVDPERRYSSPQNIEGPGYVIKGTVYMVMDNLEVKPMSIALIKSQVKEFDALEEKQVQVGLQEGLAILKASLETATVLSSVFLNKF